MAHYNVDAVPKRRIKYHLTKAEVLPSYFTDMATGPALSELKILIVVSSGMGRLTSKKENQDCYSTLLPRPDLDSEWCLFVTIKSNPRTRCWVERLTPIT